MKRHRIALAFIAGCFTLAAIASVLDAAGAR